MKKLLLILLCIPIIGVGQQTFIPDDWFETYLENNGMGNGFHYDDSVFTSAIDTVTYLDISLICSVKGKLASFLLDGKSIDLGKISIKLRT